MEHKAKYSMRDLKGDVIDAYLREPDVHETQRVGLYGVGISLVIAVCAVVVHGVNAWLFFWTATPKIIPIAVHVLAVAVVFFCAFSLKKMRRDVRFMMLLGITTAVMGVFGAVGTLLSCAMQFWHLRLAQNFMEWFATIFPRFVRTRPEDVYDNIMTGRDDAAVSQLVMPFIDIMVMGSEGQKREALSRMTAHFHPSFAPAFRKALEDPVNVIRVQAATSVARIENQFLSRLLKILDVSRRYPRDANVKLALATHYDNYAFTGILDKEREHVNRHRALEHFYEYLEMRPNDVGARIKVGRLLLRDNSPEMAAEWFQSSIENGYSTDSLHVWYLEALFASGRYEQLRTRARLLLPRLDLMTDMQPELIETVRLWAGAAVADGQGVAMEKTAEKMEVRV